MSRLRRATTISFSGKLFRPISLVNFVFVSALCVGGSSAFAVEDQSAGPSLITGSWSDPLYGAGLVLPISNPTTPESERSELFRDSSFSTLSDDFGATPVEPIPVPLPPGAATGLIGLVAAGIARYRWKLRRA